ncbi:unnamed protein product [Diamesa serratosioi]
MLKNIIVLIVVLVFVNCAHAQDESEAQVLHHDQIIEADGSYRYSFGTSNGIEVKAEASANNEVVGSYEYPGADGELVKVEYKSGIYGFLPTSGVHPAILEYLKKIIPQEEQIDARFGEGF